MKVEERQDIHREEMKTGENRRKRSGETEEMERKERDRKVELVQP